MKTNPFRPASLLLIAALAFCASAPASAVEKNKIAPQTPAAPAAPAVSAKPIDASQQAFNDQVSIQKLLEAKRQLELRYQGAMQIQNGFTPEQPGGNLPLPQYRGMQQRPLPTAADYRNLDTAASAAQPVGGYFDVTLLGFTVNRQTRDDLLENDGRGDEVFIRCATLSYDRVANSMGVTTALATKTFGDINRHSGRRVRAGMAGDRGGLATGDAVPANPFQPAPADVRGDRLPLHVFGGMLTPGRDEVLIAPTMWEWDDLGDGRTFGEAVGDVENPPFPWHGGSENDRAARLQAAIESRAGNIASAVRAIPARGVHSNFLVGGQSLRFPSVGGDMGGNRPIGMTVAPAGFGEAFAFTPQVLVLNYETAARLAQTRFDLRIDSPVPGDTARSTSTAPLPPGVIPIRYVDQGDLAGDYTLLVHIQRVN